MKSGRPYPPPSNTDGGGLGGRSTIEFLIGEIFEISWLATAGTMIQSTEVQRYAHSRMLAALAVALILVHILTTACIVRALTQRRWCFLTSSSPPPSSCRRRGTAAVTAHVARLLCSAYATTTTRSCGTGGGAAGGSATGDGLANGSYAGLSLLASRHAHIYVGIVGACGLSRGTAIPMCTVGVVQP